MIFGQTKKATSRLKLPVGASMLAMVAKDNARLLAERGALESIASKLAPTVFFDDQS
ncbi:hypothetical protein D3C80_2146520 [compost metagenome]